MYIVKRTYSGWNTAPVDGGISDMRITPGMLETGLLLSVLYSVNVTGAGAAVRVRSLPIKRVSLIADGGKYLYSIKGVDLVSKALIFEQTPVGALLVPAAAATATNKTGLEAHVPIHFQQPHAGNGFLTVLPTYAYQNLTLRVEWGTVTELFTNGGTLAGAITFTAGGQTVTQLDVDDLPIPDPLGLARTLRKTVDRYVEVTQGAAAATDLELKLSSTPGGADFRAIVITAEDQTAGATNGEPSDALINSLRLTVNNSVNLFQSVPWKSIRADNAKIFGLTMPTGVAVIDFAEDGDIVKSFPASKRDSVSLFLNTAATAANFRAHLMTLEAPLSL